MQLARLMSLVKGSVKSSKIVTFMAMGTLEDEGYARRELYMSLFRSRHRAGSA